MRAGLPVVVFGEQASQGGPQSEGTEHPAGDILDIGLFHFLIRPEGQIHALGVGDRDQLGLAFYRGTHQLECRIRPAVECLRLAVETDPLADQRVKPLGVRDRQRPQQQSVDQPECRRAGADRQRQGENGRGGGYLFLQKLAPAEHGVRAE